jgi:hypothetical protein
MTFNEFIKALTPEQVNSWWDTIAPKEAPEKVEEENWKYKLSKNGKILPFKYTVSELAIFCEIDFKSKDFSSNAANRDAFCEAFDFEVIEDLVYDNTEAQSFVTFHKSLKQTSAIFQDASNYIHNIISNNEINPYKIRMALRDAKKQAMVIIGMRAVFAFREENGKARIAMILDKELYESNKSLLNVTFEEKFNGKPENKVLISFEINAWNEIPLTIIENHTKEFLLQYNSIKNTKRATWNTEANTTNSVLKYLLFKGENVEKWISSTKKTRNHHIDFFTALEFEILNKSQGLICDRAKPEVNKYYDILKLAYEKLHYLTEIVQKEVFSKGKFNLLKKPTNQANYFQGYIWSKIYPTSKDNEDKWLAFTIGLDSDFHFNIKIDTVGLADTDKKRIEYLKKRGDFYNSKIVNRPKSDAFNNWDDLIDYCISTIKNLESDYYDLKKATALETKTENKENNFPLNQILYGPPGTGKTYTTKELAVNIINADFIKNLDKSLSEEDRRKAVIGEYDRLFQLGQIVFTTFHQSMSYEDFVEGIKPVMRGEEDGGLSYEIQDGIFKAIGNKAQSQESQESQVIVNNFEDSWNKLIELVRSQISNKKLLKIGSWDYGLSTKNSLKYSSLNSPSQYTFTITKQNVYDAFHNKKARPSGAFQKDMLDIVAFMKKELKLNENQIINYQDEKYKQNKKNYVIIIDEINRGNISQIFGELITLIEEDKRIGKDEAIEITLPYSKEFFGVPSNLYIIGTMNTADRSVEALDTALRRRFTFKELMPNSEIVNKKGFTDYSRNAIMEKINNRIEVLLDRNHTLGHAYFIKPDFKRSFENEIIPLLQEYFYNDYGKIGLVLGKGFVREKSIAKTNDKSIFADFETKNEVDIIKSYELIPFNEVDFGAAIATLLA